MKNLLTIFIILCLATSYAKGLETHYTQPRVNLINTTSYDLEELVYWTCRYLGIQDVFIRIDYLQDYYSESGMVNKFYDKAYQINLKKNVKNVKLVVIHELIHVKQYESGDLKSLHGSYVKFKGREIDLARVEYMERGFEFEAHVLDGRILNAYKKQAKASKNLDSSILLAKESKPTKSQCF